MGRSGLPLGKGMVLNPGSHPSEVEYLPKAAHGLERGDPAALTLESRLRFVSPCVYPSKRRSLSTESGSESPSSVMEAPIRI